MFMVYFVFTRHMKLKREIGFVVLINFYHELISTMRHEISQFQLILFTGQI